MSRALWFLILFVPFQLVAQEHVAGPPVPLSIQDVRRLLQQKNENLKAARVVIEAKEARTGHLARSFFPQVSANYGHESLEVSSLPKENENYWRLGASINLFRGGRDKLEENIRNVEVEAAKVDSTRVSLTEAWKAESAYWEVVGIDRLLQFRREELRQNETNLRAARRRAQGGVATNADSVQFEIYGTTLEQSISELELDLDLAKTKLAVIVGIENHDAIKPTSDFPKALALDLPATIPIEKQLNYRSVKVTQDIELQRAKQLGRWWLPSVDLYASHGVPSLDEEYDRSIRQDKETLAGVRLTVDLGQGLSDRSEAKSKELEARAAGMRSALIARESGAREHELRNQIRKFGQLLVVHEKNLERARSYLKLTNNEYQRGLKNGPDLMSASRQYFEIQEKIISLKREYLANKITLESLNAAIEE